MDFFVGQVLHDLSVKKGVVDAHVLEHIPLKHPYSSLNCYKCKNLGRKKSCKL